LDVKLKDLLVERRSAIYKGWFTAIMETYPTDTSGFLQKQQDQFANPVGHIIRQGVDGLLDALIEEKDYSEGLPFLDDILKARAVQDFTPSKAMNFIFLLKNVVRKEIGKEIRQNQITDSLFSFESKIDDLALFAFNIYVKCREQIYELKSEELKRMTYLLLKKSNLAYEIPAQEFELKTKDNN